MKHRFTNGRRDTYRKYIVLYKTNCRCSYCGKPLTVENCTIDHVIPLYRTKTSSDEIRRGIRNMVPSCEKCNNIKGGSSLFHFRNRFGKPLYFETMKKFPHKNYKKALKDFGGPYNFDITFAQFINRIRASQKLYKV